MSQCSICKSPRGENDSRLANQVWEVKCEVCGTYSLAIDAYNKLIEIREKEESKFLGFVNYTISNTQKNKSLYFKDADHVEAIVQSNPGPSNPVEKVTKVLTQIYRQINNIGDGVNTIPPIDYYRYWCSNDKELSTIINILAGEGFIESKQGPNRKIKEASGGEVTHGSQLIYLTHKGLIQGLELSKKDTISNKCFVAMSFDKSLKKIYDDVFKPAAKEVEDLTAYRIDEKEHNDNIDDHIIVEIRESRFIIADLTEHKQGVYWEAGFAEGLGKTVIYTCRKNEFDNVHFDLNHRNIIIWEEDQLDDFKQRLINRIKLTVLQK